MFQQFFLPVCTADILRWWPKNRCWMKSESFISSRILLWTFLLETREMVPWPIKTMGWGDKYLHFLVWNCSAAPELHYYHDFWNWPDFTSFHYWNESTFKLMTKCSQSNSTAKHYKSCKKIPAATLVLSTTLTLQALCTLIQETLEIHKLFKVGLKFTRFSKLPINNLALNIKSSIMDFSHLFLFDKNR